MNIYHLKVEIGFACDDPEHFSNIYTTFDNAKEAGKQYLEKKIKYVFENGEYTIKGKETPTVDELFSIERAWYEFEVEEIQDLEYAENFDIKLYPKEEYLKQNIKPTHKVYDLDYKGNIKSIDIQYRINQKEHAYAHFNMSPEDFKKGAGEKFKIGDIVTLKKDEYRNIDSETYVNKRLYVVRWLPKRVEGSPYFENTYALISNYYDGLFTHGEREYNIEKYEDEVEPESPVGFLQKIIKNEISITEETWSDLKIGKIVLDDRKNYKELLNELNQKSLKKQDIKSSSGIIGLAIGDALGVPAEFKSREELKRHPITDMIGDGTYNLPAGTWSDDTSMILATMDSILSTDSIDTNNIASKFLDWFRNAKYTATNETFDIGRTTLQALAKYELKLCNASGCGESNEYSNGNGSLMRILPIAYYIYYKDITDNQEIYNIVKQVSSITHAHEISILGCYIYVRFTLELLAGKEKIEAYNNIKKLDYSMFSSTTIDKYSRILKENIQNIDEENISSSGYVVSTLEATMWLFLNSNDYDDTILKAVNLGEDTDTVAACTGGLLGLYYGIESIKDSWKQELKKYDYIIEICDKFDKILKK